MRMLQALSNKRKYLYSNGVITFTSAFLVIFQNSLESKLIHCSQILLLHANYFPLCLNKCSPYVKAFKIRNIILITSITVLCTKVAQ
jgi:hypothetical protein